MYKKSDFDSPLSTFFLETIQRSLVYITRRGKVLGSKSWGTGVVVGFMDYQQQRMPIIFTAGHVLRHDAQHFEEVEFELTRFESLELGNPPKIRVSRFSPNCSGGPNSMMGHYSGPGAELIDLGFIVGPALCDDGKPWFETEKDGQLIPGQVADCQEDDLFHAEGTSVSWAGFPAIVTELLGHPKACYFTGTISCLIIQETMGVPFYLLDGHNAFGVSGGPVWGMCTASEKPKVFAVISGYYHDKQDSFQSFVRAVDVQSILMSIVKLIG